MSRPYFVWEGSEESVSGTATIEIGGYWYVLLLPDFKTARKISAAMDEAYKAGREDANKDLRVAINQLLNGFTE